MGQSVIDIHKKNFNHEFREQDELHEFKEKSIDQ